MPYNATDDKVTERNIGAFAERIGGVDYTLIIKGNTVVCIKAPGKNGPLYQREHYRVNQVRWRKMERFVSNECIYW